MAFFDNKSEQERKQNLKNLEDKRLAFAERLAAEGVLPERTLFAQHDGGFVGLAHDGKDLFLLTGPGPSSEDDFTCERFSGGLPFRFEEVQIKSQGMGGILGFGKKGGYGFNLIVTRPDGTEASLSLVAGQNSYLETADRKCSLFSTKRKRGNANFVWDFAPIERDKLEGIRQRWEKLINQY